MLATAGSRETPTPIAQRVTPYRCVADYITATGGAQGKEGDVVLLDGSPFDPFSRVE